LGLRNEIKIVLSSIVIAVLLGFNQVPIAEGAVSWNGFLKQVGFNPPSNYEVSVSTVILKGETLSPEVLLLCLDGDWMFVGAGERQTTIDIVTTPLLFVEGVNFNLIPDRATQPFAKAVGTEGNAKLLTSQDFDVPVTLTILCLSPSSMMTVGGEWQATDTTALIIGYSVLNAYWIAPIGIGIGLGIYLVKRRF